MWQLAGSGDLRVAWNVTDGDPRRLEQAMLADFVERYGRLPFANLKR